MGTKAEHIHADDSDIFWYINTIATVFRAANLSCLPCAPFKSQQVLVRLLRLTQSDRGLALVSIEIPSRAGRAHENSSVHMLWVTTPQPKWNTGKASANDTGAVCRKQPQLQLWNAQAVSRTKMPARTGRVERAQLDSIWLTDVSVSQCDVLWLHLSQCSPAVRG